MKLKAIIVDDEELARKNLGMLLSEYCPEVEVIGDAGNIVDAKELIESSQPDVVFLDIQTETFLYLPHKKASSYQSISLF